MKVFRSLAERFARGRVVRRSLPTPLGPIRWYVSPDAALGYLKRDVRAIDPVLWSCIERLVRPGMRVWDIGANVGLFAFAAAARCGPEGEVLAVEADPWIVANCLQRTRAGLPAGCAPVRLACAAVADRGATACFEIAARGRASNALRGLGGTQMGGVREELIVATTTLDHLLETTVAPELVKIDIEGAEGLALRGGVKLLQEVRPTILVECTHGRDEVARLLKAAGYRLFDPGRDFAAIDEPAYDTLAVPEERVSEMPLLDRRA